MLGNWIKQILALTLLKAWLLVQPSLKFKLHTNSEMPQSSALRTWKQVYKVWLLGEIENDIWGDSVFFNKLWNFLQISDSGVLLLLPRTHQYIPSLFWNRTKRTKSLVMAQKKLLVLLCLIIIIIIISLFYKKYYYVVITFSLANVRAEILFLWPLTIYKTLSYLLFL